MGAGWISASSVEFDLALRQTDSMALSPRGSSSLPSLSACSIGLIKAHSLNEV